MHDTATAGGAPDGPLLQFAARLRWQHVRGAFVGAAVRAALRLGTPLVVVAWLVPSARLPSALAVPVVAVVAGGAAAIGARRVADARLLAAGTEMPSLAVAGDELATWLERWRAGTHGEPMARWLQQDVLARLPALPAAAVAQAGRRGLGRTARLVPVLLVLVLCWFVAEWLQPPWPGALGGGPRPLPDPGSAGAGSGSGGGGGAAAAGKDREQDPQPDQPQPPDRTPPTRAPQPAPREPEPAAPPPPAEPPAPFLDLPAQQRFVVPEFVGDGPSRRVRMHAAELDQTGAAPAPVSPAGGAPDAPVPPPPARATFERAAEQALRARHVPADERPIVRRFFELLRERAQ